VIELTDNHLKVISGKVFKYGDDINTDVIFPGKYTYTINDPEDMAKHAFEDLDSEFVSKVNYGDIIVAGKNFGCGSSREQAAICLVACGIKAVIAKSFARIYFRNAINCGLAVVVCPDAVDAITNGEHIELNIVDGIIRTALNEYRFVPLSKEVYDILKAGGLISFAKLKITEA